MRENFRDDAFWGILAKTVELTTFYISDTSFALLDIKISIEGNGLCSSVYYKPTDSRSYLLYSSSHPSLGKVSISFSQFLRLRLCSDDSDFPEKSEAMSQFFDIRGYPVSVVQVGYHRAQQIDQQSALQTAKKENTYRILFTLTVHFTLATTQLNLSFLKTFNYSTTIQRLVLPFRNLHKFHSNVKKT